VVKPDAASVREQYAAVARGERSEGARGRVAFCTSTDDLDAGRGDLYVALGLAVALADAGWGVRLWPMDRWADRGPEGVDVAVVLLDSHVPGLIPADVRVVAWVRNYAAVWSTRPYLDRFDAIWCSSSASAELIRQHTSRPVDVLPLAADADVFWPRGIVRDPTPVSTSSLWGARRAGVDELLSAAEQRPVVWYGVREQEVELPTGLDYRGRADFFDLGEVYAAHQYVVDDVLESHAAYGNLNSRLFEALAAGALVVTNSGEGLAELGLEAVPVHAKGELAATLDALDADPEAVATLAERLGEVVRARHTWSIRAKEASSLLSSVMAATPVSRVDAMLDLAAAESAKARAAAAEADWAIRDAAALRVQLAELKASSSWRLTAPLRAIRGKGPGA
jgi:hypothetical protein